MAGACSDEIRSDCRDWYFDRSKRSHDKKFGILHRDVLSLDMIYAVSAVHEIVETKYKPDFIIKSI
jgi:hypothetical protein